MRRMGNADGFQGFQCYCGEWVVVAHRECVALLPAAAELTETAVALGKAIV